MWLAEMTIHKNNKILENNTFPTYIVIKIVFWNVDAIQSEKKILNKVAKYGNIDIPLLVLYNEFIF